MGRVFVRTGEGYFKDRCCGGVFVSGLEGYLLGQGRDMCAREGYLLGHMLGKGIC